MDAELPALPQARAARPAAIAGLARARALRAVLVLVSWALAVALSGGTVPPAHAQPNVESPAAGPSQPPPARLPAISGDRDDFQRALQAPVSGFLDAAAGIHSRLLPWGVNLAVLLTGLSLVWLGLRTALDRGDPGAVLSELLTLLLTAGVLFALLDRWPLVSAAVVDGTRDVARQVSGNAHDGAAAIQGVQRMVDAGFALWEHADAGITGWLDPAAMLGTLLFKLLILGLMLACSFVYLGMYLLSMSLLAIAFALGPVFVPWLLWRPASFLFDGWLRFTLTAALYQVVGIVIVTLLSRMHEPMLSSVDTAIGSASATFNFYYFAAAFLMAGVSALLMLQIPAIAGGLVSGAVSIRAQSAGLLASVPARTGAAAVSGAVRSIGRGAAVAVASAVREMQRARTAPAGTAGPATAAPGAPSRP